MPKNEIESSVRVKDESSDYEAAPAPPAKKVRKNAKKPKKDLGPSIGIKDEATGDDVMPPHAAKKPSTARKNTMTKKEKAESDAITDTPETAVTAPVKKRGTRKTAAAKTAKKEDTDADNEMKDVDHSIANAADESAPITAGQDPNFDIEVGDGSDGSVIRDKKDGNKGGRKSVAKEKPEPKV